MTVFLHEHIRGCTAVLVGREADLRLARVSLDKVREWQDAGNRVKIILPEYARHLFLDLFEHIGDGDPGFPDILIACSTGECNRLEVHAPDHGYITGSKADDITELVIIAAPDDGRDENNTEPDPF